MVKNSHRRIFSVASVILLVGSVPAFAQDAPPAPTKEGGQKSRDGASDDIVITAQRRSESVQKTSLAISVVSSNDMKAAGVGQTQDLAKLVPGVQIGAAGSQPQVYIRGVGDYGATAASNPAVAFNVDGIYIARSQAVTGNFFDVERVEILKGPQGTLYGRNASGGAINVIAKRPDLGSINGYLQAGIQNYDGYSSEGALNVPLGNTLAVRAGYQLVARSGYLSDGSDDDRHQAFRLQLLWQPSADVSLLLWGNYNHLGGKGGGFTIYDNAGNPSIGRAGTTVGVDPWTSLDSAQGDAVIAAGVARIISQRGPSPATPYVLPIDASAISQDINSWNLHAVLSAKLGGVTLAIIPAYQYTKINATAIPTFVYSTNNIFGDVETSKATSLETRLSADDGRFKWVVGGFYYNERQQIPSRTFAGFLQNQSRRGQQRTESIAAFGQASFAIVDTVRLIGGLRYTHETKEITNSALYGINPASNCFPSGPTCFISGYDGRVSVSKVNWKAGLEVDVAPNNMLFATAATGFKSGGVVLAKIAPFRPEMLTAYTLGSRNRFFDNKLQINLELFYWDYKDHQEQIIGTDDNGQTGALIRNAGKARSYGASLDVTIRPIEGGRLRLTGEYLASKYTDFTYLTPTRFTTGGATGCLVTATGTTGPAGPISKVDCSGFQLIRAPKWTGSASYSQTFSLQGGAKIDASVDALFATKRWLSVDFIPNALAPSYVTVNASLSYVAPGNKWSVTGFVRNLTNDTVYTAGVQSPYIAGFYAAAIGAPRTYGARLGVNF